MLVAVQKASPIDGAQGSAFTAIDRPGQTPVDDWFACPRHPPDLIDEAAQRLMRRRGAIPAGPLIGCRATPAGTRFHRGRIGTEAITCSSPMSGYSPPGQGNEDRRCTTFKTTSARRRSKPRNWRSGPTRGTRHLLMRLSSRKPSGESGGWMGWLVGAKPPPQTTSRWWPRKERPILLLHAAL